MRAPTGNAPAWLFAFIDLAFLLLLAMTQLSGREALDLGEIVLPRIGEEAAPELHAGAQRSWQLRIHPPLRGTSPFELIGPGSEGVRLSAGELRIRLGDLRAASRTRPLLAPHADSRSQDLLHAVELVEELWPSRRRATVERVVARK